MLSAELIQTKISIPPSRVHHVHRDRLHQRLDKSAQHKLTLVTAPAGFGKSTLLASWAEKQRAPVAWVALEEDDRDPGRFMTYFLSSLQSAVPQLRLAESTAALRRDMQLADRESLLSFLVNECRQLHQPVWIVLDDYYLVDFPGTGEILTFLLDHLPPAVHVVIASRQDPSFPLARLRASGHVLEIGAQEMRFTQEEAARFLQDVMGLRIGPAEIALLEERTEGWVAGLQLAALSLEGRPDASGFIAELRGTDRFILDYLAEEVFGRLPASLQPFLLRISIVSRFDADLCDALTAEMGGVVPEGVDGRAVEALGSPSRPVLEFLDASNLFVVPLDHERLWYRFHQLFADFLRDRLDVLHPEEVPTLHRRAAQWFASHGLLAEAIQHALRAGDPETAADLIASQVRPMLERGETRALARWIEALPEYVLDEKPALLFGLVWTYVLGDPVRFQAEIRDLLARFSAALGVSPENVLEALAAPDLAPPQRDLLGQFGLLVAFLGRDRQPFQVTIALFQAAETAFAESDYFTRAFAHSLLASTYARQGNLALAQQAFARSSEIGQRSGSPYLYLVAKDWEATVQAQRGHLRQASANFRFVVDQLSGMTADRLPLTGHPFVGLADVLREQNQLEHALQYVTRGIERGERTMDRDALREGYLLQARILAALGDTTAAEAALQEGLREAVNSGTMSCVDEAEAWAARLRLGWGDHAPGVRWAEERNLLGQPASGIPDSLPHIGWMALARVHIEKGDLRRAESLLRHMLHLLEKTDMKRAALEIRCQLSAVLQASGDRDSAQQTIAKALVDAEPEGFVRVFVDQGARMAALLRNVAAGGQSPAYVATLLQAFGQELSADTPIEPLSERELEVLRLLSEGLTNAAIARELVVAHSTVKTHVNHIYAKLGVTRRTQAVARARDLHLVP